MKRYTRTRHAAALIAAAGTLAITPAMGEPLTMPADETAPTEEKTECAKPPEAKPLTGQTKQVAYRAINNAVKDQSFVAGFGNNGGEEFLSYMNISETLRAKGGKEWNDWDKKISGSINTAQNEDGSWAGHHCITGRTFCTAGALLTLMADRAPIPVVVAKGESETVSE